VRAEASARQLIDAGAWVLIGPESTEVAERVKPLLDEHDVLLLSPLVGAADERDVDCDNPWFRLAPSARVLGQALAKRMHADGHRHAAILSSEGAYDLALADAFESMLSTLDGETSYRGLLRRDAQSYAADVEGALDAGVDALLLSAAPRSAALAVNELGVLSRARPQLYLSPLLKTELLLQNVVPEVLDGAIGVTPRIVETSDEFPTAFARRWAGDQPLEGAYFYYDAMALVAFGLERAMQSSSHPGASALSAAILDESHGPGEAGRWNELRPLLPRLRQGEHIYYTGLTGAVLLRPCGDRQSGATSDWQVQAGAITDL
jgi:ABC-type branched-subunit amino acid transport system substrate-binding protein